MEREAILGDGTPIKILMRNRDQFLVTDGIQEWWTTLGCIKELL